MMTRRPPATVLVPYTTLFRSKVENLGPSDNTGFTVTDTLAAGTSFVSATTPDCANSGGTVTCTSAGLASGASVTWTITAHVSASYSGTTVDNTAAIEIGRASGRERGESSRMAVTADEEKEE